MTTNGDEDVPITNGDMPCADGDAEGSGQVMSCDGCKKAKEELARRQRDHTFYTALKKKIALTDSLIRKYSSKCQEFDQQQRTLEDVTYKLASTKRDCKVFEEQLTTTLKEVIPWKLDKDRYLKELEDCRTQLRNTKDKLDGSEASCDQFKDGFLEMQDKLETLEGNQADLKREVDKSQQAEKKASALLAKNKSDLLTSRKELKSTKKREAKLATQHQRAKSKISELVDLLHDHGIPVPKIPRSLLGGSAHMQDGASTEDTDFERVDDVFSPPKGVFSPAEPELPSKEAGLERTGRKPSQEDACLKILDRFSCDMSKCVSPLPPSPRPPSPVQAEEPMSDASSIASGDDRSNDDAFSDVADQIESQLNLIESEGIQDLDASPEGKEKGAEGRQIPQRNTKTGKKLTEADVDMQDVSEEDILVKQRSSRNPSGTGVEKGTSGMPTPNSKLEGAEESRSNVGSELTGHIETISSESGDSTNPPHSKLKRPRQKRSSERKSGKGKESSTAKEVSGRASLNVGKDQERQFKERSNEELVCMSSTLSEDSDSSLDFNKDPLKKLHGDQGEKSSCVAELASPPSVERTRPSPPQTGLEEAEDKAWAEHKKLLLSPDRRLTRAQLKTLTEQGVIEPTNIVVPVATIKFGKNKGKCQNEGATDEEKIDNKQEGTSDHSPFQAKGAVSVKTSSEHSKQTEKDSPRRPVTRSLSLSENESLTEATPLSPARPVPKMLLRSNSVPEEKTSTEGPSTELPVDEVDSQINVKSESSTSCTEVQTSTVKHSPRRLPHSGNFPEQSPGIKDEKMQTSTKDSKLTSVQPQGNFSKGLARSVSVPGNSPSRMDANNLEDPKDSSSDDTSTRRLTRSQVHMLQTPSKEEIFLKRMTRSAAQKLAVKTGAEILSKEMTGLTSSRTYKRSQSDSSPNKTEKAFAKEDRLPKRPAENDKSGIGSDASPTEDAHSGVQTSNQGLCSEFEKLDNSGSESEQTSSRRLAGSSALESEGGKGGICDAGSQQDETELTRSVSSSEMNLTNAQLRESPKEPLDLTALQTDVGTSEDKNLPEVNHAVASIHDGCQSDIIPIVDGLKDNDTEPSESKQGQKLDDSNVNGVGTLQREACATECSDEALPEDQISGDKNEKLDESKIVKKDELCGTLMDLFDSSSISSVDSMTPKTKSEFGNQEVNVQDFSPGEDEFPAAELSSPVAPADLNACSNVQQSSVNSVSGEDKPCAVQDGGSVPSHEDLSTMDDGPEEAMEHEPVGLDQDGRQGSANNSVIEEANLCDLPGRESGSSRKDSSNGDDGPEEAVEHQPAGVDGELSGASEEARNHHSTHSGAVFQPVHVLRELQHISSGEASTSSNHAPQHQVQCVEAESSRASTPTTDEVISIDSMSGHVSPVSPLPFYDTTRPLSPLSSPPRSPPLSPLIPSPLSFDGIVNLPRMLSPLPPSPVIPDMVSVDEIRRSPLAEGIPGAGLVGQPRMISPLFPTPVPPAVSPLPEAPMPNVLSPLSDMSPVRPGQLSALGRSPMTSPLRNPLIPSPCNFHAVAPQDALSVRPQHYPAPRRQPASRCLAVSFTTTRAGMSQNPEIISPRLHSLASEILFEFGESHPSTSGLRRQVPLTTSSNSSQESNTNQATDVAYSSEKLEGQGQSPAKHGFIKLRSRSTKTGNNPEDPVIKKQDEVASEAGLGEGSSTNKQDSDEKVQKQLSESDSKDDKSSPDQQKCDQPRMKNRIKPNSSQIQETGKSPQRLGNKKTEENVAAVSDNKFSIPDASSKEVEDAASRRCTRSQAASNQAPPSDSDHPQPRRQTSARLRRKDDEGEKDLESVSKTTKRRKKSKNLSNQTEIAEKDAASQQNEQADDASCTTEKNTEDRQMMETVSASPERSSHWSTSPKKGRVILIPALEQKKSGFKKSGSLRRRQEAKQDVGDPVEAPHEGETNHSPVKEEITTGPGKPGSNEEVTGTGKPVALENEMPDGDGVNNEAKPPVGQDNGNICRSSVEQGGPNKTLVIPVQSSGTEAGTPGEQSFTIAMKRPVLNPSPGSVSVPSSWEVAQTKIIAAKNVDVKIDQKALSKPSKAKANIGSIWGSMASRKDPGISVFNRGPKRKRKSSWVTMEADPGSSQNPGICRKPGSVDERGHILARAGAGGDTGQAFSDSSEPVLSSQPQSGQALLRQPTNSETGISQPRSGANPRIDESATRQPMVSAAIASEPRLAGLTAPPQSSSVVSAALSTSEPSATNASNEELTPETAASNVTLQCRPGPAALIQGSESELGHGARTTATDGHEFVQFATSNQDSRKRHISAVGNSAYDTDEQPSPRKQPKISLKRPVKESRPEAHQLVPEVKPSMSKVRPSGPKFCEPVLEDLLQRIKALRSQTNVKPLCATILTFVGQQSINLMPAIRAKCLVKNTSDKPLILPHEEELVSCILDSGLPSKKSSMGLLLACLCRGVQNPPMSTSAKPALVVGAAFCRVFVALSRQLGLTDRVRVFCYDLLREGFRNVEELLLNVAVTWPTVLKKEEGLSSPVLVAIEVVTMHRLVLAAVSPNLHAQMILQCFGEICGWEITEGNLPTIICHRLVTSIQDTNTTKLYKTGTPTQALTSKSYEIVKALELLAYHQGWQWTNDHLIRDQLWPILKKWSHEVQAANAANDGSSGSSQDESDAPGTGGCAEFPVDASACAVMKVMGGIACMGLNSNKQSVYELLKMLAAVLQQPSASVPWTVQVFTAEAILCLSPSNPTFALEVIEHWRQKMPVTLPARIEDKVQVLVKVVRAIINAPQ